MHHQDDEKLRQLVILDPGKFLIGPASLVMADHAIHENSRLLAARSQAARLYQKLTKKGILHDELLDILWEDRAEHIEILQTLLVKLGFFVPILQDVKSTTTSAGPDDNCYLIPHLLPQSLTLQARDPRLVGYIIFALTDVMQDIRANGYVSLEDIARDGFLPMGLGPAVMGQVESEL